MGLNEWERYRAARIDRALTEFIRKKISADEYKIIREQTFEEFLAERSETDNGTELVTQMPRD